MMFSHNLVAAIKVSGKILREYDDTVLLPFGVEYSVLLKNLNSVRALVKVSIDGTDATSDTWLILPPNSDLELERFIRDGNFERGNRFKFIERTAQIEQHRGTRPDDGLIRVEYKFEQPSVQPLYQEQYWNGIGQWLGGNGGLCRGITSQSSSFSFNSQVTDMGTANMGTVASCSLNSSAPASDVGITVAGSESQQRFVAGAWFPTEAISHVLVLRLRGEVVGKPVVKAVTVDHKPKCVTCGQMNKATAKFCPNCGTAAVLVRFP